MRSPRNLLGRLLVRTSDELRDIAICWDVPLATRDHAANAGRLYSVMRDIWAVRDRAEMLSPGENAIVDEMLMASEDSWTVADLSGDTEFDPRPAIAALERCGILHREQRQHDNAASDDAFFLPRELVIGLGRVREEQLLGDALGPRAPLRALLSTLETSELEAAAPIWGLRITPGLVERDLLTDELLARVRLPNQRREVIQGLTGHAAAVFQALRAAERPLPVHRLRDRLKLDASALRDAARLLAARLLVWHAYTPADRFLFIPRDIVAPRVAPRDQPPRLVETRATPRPPFRHPFGAPWDLLALLRGLTLGAFEWHEGDEDRNATHVRRIAPALWPAAGALPPRGYLPLLLGLAADEGLVRMADGVLTATDRVEAWRARSFPDQLQRLFTLWRGATNWLEGASQDELHLTYVDWPAMRQALLEQLRELPVDVWFDAHALALHTGRLHPSLLGGKFSAALASGANPTRDEVTVQAVSVALHGGLARLGVLTTGEQAGGRPALALSPTGAWLLGARADPPMPAASEPSLVVGADFSVQLRRPTPRRIWALGAISDVVQLDTVSRYRLSRPAVRRAIATGVKLEQILTFLERGAGTALPQGVVDALTEWSAGHRGLRLSHALMVRLDESDQAARLAVALEHAAMPAALPLPSGGYAISLPTVDRLDLLLDALRAAGFALHWEE